VGRYAQSLALAMAARAGEDELRLCFNAAYAGNLAQTMAPFELAVGRGRLSAYRYPHLAEHDPPQRAEDALVAATLVRRHWMSLQPDVVHVAHVFEGFQGRATVPKRWPAVAGVLRAATLYDLIPLRMPHHYLADTAHANWYRSKLDTLRECDLLLAISQSTRADAVDLLGIDARRISIIWAGVDAVFRAAPRGQPPPQAVLGRHGISKRFVLYTGGDDPRKNLEGAIAGFAALPGAVREHLQFVIVCSMSEQTRVRLVETARRLGVGDAVVLAGFVDEHDLVALYNHCATFVFPSLYEGFGLPVVEAMACGAPVIGADNSGIGEIIARRDAVFDAANPAALAQRLHAVLGDADFREDLRDYGLRRAREFTWERSADLALDAMRDARSRGIARAGSRTVVAVAKPRIALFTPLPPCKSGIADYNAAFMPHLARHFDIDVYVDDYEVSDPALSERFAVLPHTRFGEQRGRYDAIVYEMGNSEFHAYMLDYLARYPGVVVLHDAFLSGLYGYVDFNLGRAGSYQRALLGSHGPRGRRYLAPVQGHPDPIGASMVNLPVSKMVIDAAIGVISHTPFNLDVATSNYPEGWAAPYRIIKQMVRLPPLISDAMRVALRGELGFGTDDFLVCTFGHVTWTKSGDVLLDAFTRSALETASAAKLVFVGEMARDAFGHRLTRAIEASEFASRVRVTGYIDESTYAKYLAVADLSVQLRTHTRGGTSKAILDCLAHGVALIANEAGSFADYPEGVIRKIGTVPDAAELADALTHLRQDSDGRAALRAAGRNYVIREHDAERIAAQYAEAIPEMIARAEAASLPAALHEIGATMVTSGAHHSVKAIASALQEDLLQPRFARRRIVVDVSHIAEKDHQTGIQRVVRNTVRWLYCAERAGFDVVAVRLEGNRLVQAVPWLVSQGLVAAEGPSAHGEMAIEWRAGDILLMLDSSWAKIDAYLPLFEKVRVHLGRIYCVVYDLLPIRFPHLFVEGGAQWFTGWLDKALRHSDGCICISRAVADEVLAYLRVRREPPPARLGFWHLGSDFLACPGGVESERVRRALRGRCVLMVGTVEPRKNHALALEAFERLWSRGVDVTLCIAGKPGWNVDVLLTRLRTHPEIGSRLHLLEDPSDPELAYAYAHSAGVLLASAGEGFGLPLVEAAQFGTPILASDIAVFREIAGEHASYFALGSPDDLAAAIEQWLALPSSKRPDAGAMPRLSWEQSALGLLDVLLDDRWYKLRRDA